MNYCKTPPGLELLEMFSKDLRKELAGLLYPAPMLYDKVCVGQAEAPIGNTEMNEHLMFLWLQLFEE